MIKHLAASVFALGPLLLVAAPATGQVLVNELSHEDYSWLPEDSTWTSTVALGVRTADDHNLDLTTSLIGDLRRMGVRRILVDESLEDGTWLHSVCFVSEFKPTNRSFTNWAMIVRITVPLVDDVLYLGQTQGIMGDDAYTTETYVETCADVLSRLMIDELRLGR